MAHPCPHEERPRRALLCTNPRGRVNEGWGVEAAREPAAQASEKTLLVGTLTLGTSSLQNCENCLLFEPPKRAEIM